MFAIRHASTSMLSVHTEPSNKLILTKFNIVTLPLTVWFSRSHCQNPKSSCMQLYTSTHASITPVTVPILVRTCNDTIMHVASVARSCPAIVLFATIILRVVAHCTEPELALNERRPENMDMPHQRITTNGVRNFVA